MLVDLGLVNFAMKTDTKFLFTLQRVQTFRNNKKSSHNS